MEKKRAVLKTAISLVVIFSFLLTGCGMMRKVDNLKAETKLMEELTKNMQKNMQKNMEEQTKSMQESIDLLTAYNAVEDHSEPNIWTRAVNWYVYLKNSVEMSLVPFVILGNIANNQPWYAGLGT